MTASNAQLLTYGLPERPDQATDARGYAVWERSMLALKIHATDVQATPYSSMNAIPNGPLTTNVDGTTSQSFLNWSGIANTNTQKLECQHLLQQSRIILEYASSEPPVWFGSLLQGPMV